MEWNGEQKKIIDKVEFYKTNELICHILTIPRGTFKNGRIVSTLQQECFFWFIELETSIPIRIFLSEIYDIKDYKEKEKDVKRNWIFRRND